MLKKISGLLFFFITFTAGILVAAPLAVVAGRFKQRNLVFNVVGLFFSILFKIWRIRIKVKGQNHIHPNRSYLVLANHQSFLDIPIILRHVLKVSFVAKIEINRWPLFGPGMRQMRCIFVDRKDPVSRKSVGPQMLANMQSGISYCVFPEGTRTKNGKLLPFRPGIFRIAKDSNLLILPVSIKGSFQRLSKDSLSLSPGNVTCIIHRAVRPDSFESAETLMAAVRKNISSAL